MGPRATLVARQMIVMKYKYTSIINNVALVQAMKAYGEVKVQLHSFENLTVDGCEWSTSRPGRFIPQETALGMCSVMGPVGPEASLNASEDRNVSCSGRGSNQYSSIQPVAYLHSKEKYL